MKKSLRDELKNIFYYIKKLMGLVRPHSRTAVGKIILGICLGITGLVTSWLLGQMMDIALDGDLTELLILTSILVSMSVIESGGEYFNNLLSGKYRILCGRTLRSSACRKVNKLSISYYEKNHTGATVSTVINDIDKLEMFYLDFVDKLCSYLPTQLIGGLILLSILNFRLLVICIILIPLLSLLTGRISMKLSKLTSQRQGETENFNTLLGDFIRGIHIYKSYDMENIFDRKFKDSCNEIARYNFRIFRTKDIAYSIREVSNVIPRIIVYVIGGIFIFRSELTVGGLFTFASVLFPVIYAIENLSHSWTSITEAVGNAKHYFKLLDAEEERSGGMSPDVSRSGPIIEFRKVSYSYHEGLPVINDLSFSVFPGEKVAIVGPSGCGKSTIHKLLAGHYENYTGEIRIGGIELSEWDLTALRHNISSVTQEVYLFEGSVRKNIGFGKVDSTEDEIRSAAKKAYALDFINETEEGFDTNIGEQGSRMSGGQKQRLAIARTILKNAPILLLDEPTSALDTKAEYYVQKALENLGENKTEIVIAHRMSTIESADKILVIEAGRLAESGRHDELVNMNGRYSRLYERELAMEGGMSV